MTAKRKPLATLSLTDLSMDAPLGRSTSTVLTISARPARTAGKKIVDDGTASAVIVANSVESREAAARFAVRTGAGLLADVVDLWGGRRRLRGRRALGLRRRLHR